VVYTVDNSVEGGIMLTFKGKDNNKYAYIEFCNSGELVYLFGEEDSDQTTCAEFKLEDSVQVATNMLEWLV